MPIVSLQGLRLHDNPALLDACKSKHMYPVFVIDPHFLKSGYRWEEKVIPSRPAPSHIFFCCLTSQSVGPLVPS